jgi:ABC-type multidrug transport system fused ATPase/permease subunit
MISLIERFYDPQEGSIEFSGVNIKELEPRWYKQ